MSDHPEDFDWPPIDHDTYPQADGVAADALEVVPEVVPGSLRDDALDDLPIAMMPPSAHAPADRPDDHEAPAAVPSRMATWTVAAALLVGLACGFGGGYLARGGVAVPGSVRRGPGPTVTAPRAAAAPAAREFTESAINDSPGDPARAPGRDTDRDSDRAPMQSEPSVATGRLLVRSSPADAQVFVDGREQGRTPAAIHDLTLGTHLLRVVREGYLAADRRIVVTAAQPAQSVSVELARSTMVRAAAAQAPEPPPPAVDGTLVGALDVESRPPGAQVFLDGTLVGTTPFASTHVGAGRHAIGLERNGYRRWLSSVWIAHGERSRITASLER